MKNLLFTPIILLALTILLAFSPTDQNHVFGTYGVNDSDPSNIELVLMKDWTFTFQDHSIVAEKIQLSGTWKMKNSMVVLSSEVEIDFHSKWKITKDGRVAKSRKGLTF